MIERNPERAACKRSWRGNRQLMSEPWMESLGQPEPCDWYGRPGIVRQYDVDVDGALACRHPSLCDVCFAVFNAPVTSPTRSTRLASASSRLLKNHGNRGVRKGEAGLAKGVVEQVPSHRPRPPPARRRRRGHAVCQRSERPTAGLVQLPALPPGSRPPVRLRFSATRAENRGASNRLGPSVRGTRGRLRA